MTRAAITIAATVAAIWGGAPSSFAAEKVSPVFQRGLPDVPGRTLTIAKVYFAPGTSAPAHRHGRAFVYAYVLTGTVTSQLAGEPAQTFHAGQGWFEPPGARHLLTRNASRTRPAQLLVVFVAETGAPLKTPDEEEEHTTMPQMSELVAPAGSGAAAPAPQQMVDALYSAFGDHHSRAVHAKGIMAEGTFTPSAEAASLSRASIFAGGSMPVLVRFSDFTGIPEIPDTAAEANPRGFAMKFQLPDGTSADVIAHSFNGFPTATSAEFRQLLLAIGASGPGAAKPTALDTFLAGHPIAKTFLTTQKPAPESYATLTYFGVNAFALTNAHGHRVFVRYRFVPEGGEAPLSPERLAAMGPDYLQTELPARLSKGPAMFTWYAQIADAGDVIGDPSVAWPENRKQVRLGVIRLERIAPATDTADKATTFRPLNVPAGIAPADPMLGIRQEAYPLSSAHRQ